MKNTDLQVKNQTMETFLQNEYIVRTLIKGAGGKCELCGKKAPFKDKNGNPYLELRALEKDFNIKKEEIEKKIVALCPNCNRKLDVLEDPADFEKLSEIAAHHDY